MEDREFNYINAIPLIDVMLVLLTITLTTATFITQGAIKINLPSSVSTAQKEPVIIDVVMTNDKKIYVNNIQTDKIVDELSKYNAEDTVMISADKSLNIDDLTSILGYIQEAGFKKMSIKTELPIIQ
ncbi:MAG: biopolymer transporter ExbD [Campylobacteraceae bacterium]|jgi:biopolymer transport protein ExbD|nr:biopolymer transporter ExbD [Campylobacteraceae bacterium]